jgi:ferrous iron transport protein A
LLNIPYLVIIKLLISIILCKINLLRKLSDLAKGERGVIHSFEKDDIFIKLMEMGCVPGEVIEVEQVALTGDPISVFIAGYNLSLRRDEAAQIFVSEI